MSYAPQYYQYSPLNEEMGEIRLVTILPGLDGSVRLAINKYQLSEDTVPSYEALSYVWGSTQAMVNLCVGDDTPELLPVTPNLAKCLAYLRLPNEPRTLWIDAICINQEDLKERKHQVGRMADIYKLAARVVVWLGPQTNDSLLAFEALESLAAKIEVDWDRWTMKATFSDDSELHWGDLNQQFPYQAITKSALKALFDRPWFERLWVQQEIRLAKDAILLSGRDTISWSSIRSAVFCMWVKGWKCGHIVDKNHLELAYNMAKESRVSIVMLFDNTKACKCSDLRDKVYALLACLREEDKMGIEADYTKTVAQVYQETVQRYIEHHNRLGILTRCNLSTRHNKTPSWVPNFAKSRGSKRLIDFNADGESSCNARIFGKTLRVKGLLGATVTHAENVKFSSNVQEFVAEILRLAPPNTGTESYIGGGTTLEAFASTLYVGEFSSYWMPSEDSFPGFKASVKILQHMLDTSKEPHSAVCCATMLAYAENLDWNFQGRAFITTQEGLIGAAPAGVVPGDQIVILLGCRSPLVLRPVDNRQHVVVGECYVPGLMQGESLLGPLPEGYRLVYEYEDESKRHRWAYANGKTGKVQIEDPRLSADSLNSREVKMRDFFIV